jgi:hypothetical protein
MLSIINWILMKVMVCLVTHVLAQMVVLFFVPYGHIFSRRMAQGRQEIAAMGDCCGMTNFVGLNQFIQHVYLKPE